MSQRTETDEALAEQAKNAAEGDLRAFDELVRRHQDAVMANCRYITRSPSDAPDLTQEVFVKAFFGLARFEGRAPFRPWLKRIKVNHCLNFLRKRKDKTFVDVGDEALESAAELQVAPRAEHAMAAANEREMIRMVLDELPDTLRLPLILRDLDELSYQEVADSLGIGLSATKMRIKRAREEFRARYTALQQSLEKPTMENVSEES